MSHAFSPVARAVLDSVGEGIVVFDQAGELMYANHPGVSAIDALGEGVPRNARALVPELTRCGARVEQLRVGGIELGQVVYVPAGEVDGRSLAQREKRAILDTLEATGWRLAESARALGISRTTLWRRLKEYGFRRDGRGRWSQPS